MTRRGETLAELAEDKSSPGWRAAARLTLEVLETEPTIREACEVARLTGKQTIVLVLRSTRHLSFRDLASLLGCRPHAIEKHHASATKKFMQAGIRAPLPDKAEQALADQGALELLTTSAPFSDDGWHGPATREGRLEARREARDEQPPTVRLRLNSDGTYWPDERWQPPAGDDFGCIYAAYPLARTRGKQHKPNPAYGRARRLPQDADATRDVLADERKGRHFRHYLWGPLQANGRENPTLNALAEVGPDTPPKRQEAAMVKLLLVDEVADALRVRHDKVLDLVNSGHLEGVRLGRRTLRIKQESLERLLAG